MSRTSGGAREIDITQVTWIDRLGRGAHGETWLARVGAMEICVAKRVLCDDGAAQQRLLRRLGKIAACRDPALAPVVGMARDGDAVVVLRAFDPGASLSRIVSIGSLAARHVGALAEGILQGLTALEAAGLVHGAIDPGNVFVSGEGRITLCDAGLAPQPYPRTQRQADLEAMTSLLLDAWGSARRTTNPGLATLLEQHGLSRGSKATAALDALLEVWPESDRANGRAGLGDFARRISGDGARAPRQVPLSAVSAIRLSSSPVLEMSDKSPGSSTDAIVLSQRPQSRISGRGAGALLMVAVLLSLVVVLVLHHVPASPKGVTAPAGQHPSARASPQPATSPGASARPGFAALQPPAPAASGYIEGAALTVAPQGCAPGQACTLMSRINLGQHATGTVAWEVVSVGRCSGAEIVLASASGTDEESYEYMWQNISAALPEGPLALYTVTVSPVRVASRVVDVPAGPANCLGKAPDGDG
jgi:hypothetical protein